MLKRLAALQGVSMAGVVTGILDECYPVLERVCTVLEKAKHAQASSLDGIREAMAQAEAQLRPAADDVNGAFDLMVTAIESASRTPPPPLEERAGRGRGKVVNPRVVTRGSGFIKENAKAPLKAAKLATKKGSKS
jgi:hypothetical protein